MKHLLPGIEPLLRHTFVILEEGTHEIVDSARLLDQNKVQDVMCFYRKNGQLYYLPASIPLQCNVLVDQLPWMKTMTLPHTVPFDTFMREIEEFGAVLITDESGLAIGYVTGNDVLHEVYQAYKYVKVYFDSVLETTEESIAIIDEQATAIVWTRGAEQMFSIKRDEIIGRPMFDFFPYENLNTLRTLKTGERLHRLKSQPRNDVVLLLNVNPIELDGNIIGAVSVDTDISNEVRLYQELFDSTKKIEDLRNEVIRLDSSHNPFYSIKGKSRAIMKTIDLCQKIASTNATCLIHGESGVGKELFAKAIHVMREKNDAPFIAINCGAIPPTLFESEFFGYEKGAFSGANQKGSKGKIGLAQNGTLFLDEVGELTLDMQVKLLRVLQEKKYYPVGGSKEIEVDFRVIAATNRNLQEMVDKGEFREDLYYRLHVINLTIPPLRERLEDILEITKLFLYEFSIRYNRFVKEIPDGVMDKLVSYHWPGNVRELRNVIERLVVFATDGKILEEHLPLDFQNVASQVAKKHLERTIAENRKEDDSEFLLPKASSLQSELDLYEKKLILQALSLEGGNKLSVAKRLGISRSTLYYKMHKLGIE
ncbi:sigma-54 interaction domain-containing protein [Brevibacillus reuszeri]|uniref:sigma-54 interaction domain-containing protein n=1 Tax=Brevibacillus reuszeri TaxID=54915 RepID=UPI003D1B9B3F